jgi:predicted GNAT family acetyltransferase
VLRARVASGESSGAIRPSDAIFGIMNPVTDNVSRQRFELVEEGKLAFADYRASGDVLILPHVEADPALRGRGTAGRLMAGVMEIVRERGLKVRPVCGYAVAWLERHPEYAGLVERGR